VRLFHPIAGKNCCKGEGVRGDVPHEAGARSSKSDTRSAEELVRVAYKAFSKNDAETLRGFCDSAIVVRPVDALGLVGDTLHGFDAARDWMEQCFELGLNVSVWLRTLQEVGSGRVLGVGAVSERGGGCAATVAWVWHVSDDRIGSVYGYSSEAAARRSLRAAA
jgi:ketosteroid isomerase-like protein